MKNILFLLFMVPLFAAAQTYPFSEGFEGLASTQVPPGWGGSMKVLLYHGQNDSKGLAARVSSGVTVDSSITPHIGPLTSSSFISFYYRIIDQAIYPSTPTDLEVGDQIEVMVSTDSVNYTTIQLIDMNNHNPSFNFVKKKIFVTQYADSNVYFKIRCQYGTGSSFYADFDTLVVASDPQLAVSDITPAEQITIYPNPCSSFCTLQLPVTNSFARKVKVYSVTGETIFEKNIPANFQLSTADWNDGIYFVQVKDSESERTLKLIVQH